MGAQRLSSTEGSFSAFFSYTDPRTRRGGLRLFPPVCSVGRRSLAAPESSSQARATRARKRPRRGVPLRPREAGCKVAATSDQTTEQEGDRNKRVSPPSALEGGGSGRGHATGGAGAPRALRAQRHLKLCILPRFFRRVLRSKDGGKEGGSFSFDSEPRSGPVPLFPLPLNEEPLHSCGALARRAHKLKSGARSAATFSPSNAVHY